MSDPELALRNWLRVVKPGGYLILYVPHRELYEKRKMLPSRWNIDHKFFILPEFDEPPDTLGLVQLVKRALGETEIVYHKVCDEGHTIVDPDLHSDGEYSIEMVVRKTAR
jgi:SAM-dependent methyltransferase